MSLSTEFSPDSGHEDAARNYDIILPTNVTFTYVDGTGSLRASLLYSVETPLTLFFRFPILGEDGYRYWPIGRELLEEACTTPLDNDTPVIIGEGDVRILPDEDDLRVICSTPHGQFGFSTPRADVEDCLNKVYRFVQDREEEQELIEDLTNAWLEEIQ